MANYFLTYLTTAQTGIGVTDNVATLSAFTNEVRIIVKIHCFNENFGA